MVTASRISGALRIAGRRVFSQDGDHGHCTFPRNHVPETTAFCPRFLFGINAVDTNVVRSTGNWKYNATWAPWTAPQLVQAGVQGGGTTTMSVSRASLVMVPAAVLAAGLAGVVGGLL